jgi:hypothetical protein
MIKVWRAVFARIYHHRLWKPLPTQPPKPKHPFYSSTTFEHYQFSAPKFDSCVSPPKKKLNSVHYLYKNFALLDPDPDCENEKYGSPIES